MRGGSTLQSGLQVAEGEAEAGGQYNTLQLRSVIVREREKETIRCAGLGILDIDPALSISGMYPSLLDNGAAPTNGFRDGGRYTQ